MIEIKTFNEDKEGFTLSVQYKGEASLILDELVAIFDHLYKNSPKLFEDALILSRYTEDHT